MVSLVLMMMTVLLEAEVYVWTLPPPCCVSMETVDMTHILRWRPLQASCNTTVLYSVQFQGEFEMTVLNNSWIDAPECQWTPLTHCDLTFDLGSDSDYNLRVQAHCGSLTSDWTQPGPPFNRRHMLLKAPQMLVTAVGDALHVSFEKLPVTAVVRVTVSRRGDKLQADVYTLPAELTSLQIASLQDGSEYCVTAQSVLQPHLYSNSTAPQCVSITGPEATWRRPTTVTLTVIILAVLLSVVFWAVVHYRSDTCQSFFRKESLPCSLRPDWNIQTQPIFEEVELCEQVHLVYLEHLETEP